MPASPETKHGRPVRLLLQIVGSALVLVLLLRDTELAQVREALSGFSTNWLLLAMALKGLGITLRELRLWVAVFPWKRLPLFKVLGIGYCSGLVNNVVPVRGGDLLAIALLRAECGLPATAAMAGVAVTSLAEATVFAVFLLVSALCHAHEWSEILGTAASLRSLGLLSALTLSVLFASAILVLAARRWKRRQPIARAVTPLALLRKMLTDTGTGLGAAGPMAANTGMALLQVFCMVGSYQAILTGLPVQVMAPQLAASLVLATGSFAAIVLPPGFAAGSAATSVLVLGFFGLRESEALAFAALAWLSHMLPIIFLGAGPLWTRLGNLPRLLPGEKST